MKITKRQLKRIIAEEKQRIMKESVTDMSEVSLMISQAAIDIAAAFEDMMYKLQDEMGPGEISPTWEDEVDRAGDALEDDVQAVIEAAVQKIEAQLHDGAFYRG